MNLEGRGLPAGKRLFALCLSRVANRNVSALASSLSLFARNDDEYAFCLTLAKDPHDNYSGPLFVHPQQCLSLRRCVCVWCLVPDSPWDGRAVHLHMRQLESESDTLFIPPPFCLQHFFGETLAPFVCCSAVRTVFGPKPEFLHKLIHSLSNDLLVSFCLFRNTEKAELPKALLCDLSQCASIAISKRGLSRPCALSNTVCPLRD